MPTAVAVTADGASLVAGSEDGAIWVVSAGRASKRDRRIRAFTKPVRSLALSPGGSKAIATAGGTARLFDLVRGKSTAVLRSKGRTHAVAWSPDGRTVATAGTGPFVSLFSATGKRVSRIRVRGGPVRDLAFSPDSRLLAVGIEEGEARLYDLGSGALRISHRAHEGPVSALAFDPAGRSIASGGLDGKIHVFSVEHHRLVQTLEGHTLAVTELQFTPDGERIVSGSLDGTRRIWTLPQGTSRVVLADGDQWAVIGAEGETQCAPEDCALLR